jgi:hypothetical protein
MGAGVGDDERSVSERGNVKEACLVEVGAVNQDTETVTDADELATRRREAGADVGRVGEGEGNAVAEGVGAGPDEAE